MKKSKKSQSKPQSKYWFYAKDFGWGWGRPARIEGWLVYLLYLVTVVGFESWLEYDNPNATSLAVAGVVLPTIALVWICIQKGEPTKWSWGNKSPKSKI